MDCPRTFTKPNEEPGKYLAFLGRISPGETCGSGHRNCKAWRECLCGGGEDRRGRSRNILTKRSATCCASSDVEFIGEIGEQDKTEFLGNAAALLFPDRLAGAVWAGDD